MSVFVVRAFVQMRELLGSLESISVTGFQDPLLTHTNVQGAGLDLAK